MLRLLECPAHRSCCGVSWLAKVLPLTDLRVTYLREGGVRDLPGGGVEYDRIRSAGDLWTYQIGISVGGR
jgi:hypothetical protein